MTTQTSPSNPRPAPSTPSTAQPNNPIRTPTSDPTHNPKQ